MQKTWFFSLFLVLLLLGCSNASVSEQSSSSFDWSQAESDSDYLAYEHSVTVDLPEDAIESTVKAIVQECRENQTHLCTVLDSDVGTNGYAYASVRMRLKPQSVDSLLSIASKPGVVVGQSTHVEDLAEPIIDSERQQKMLEAYLQDLQRLKVQSADNVDALIKVTSEIASTQSKLEALQGEYQYLKRRVNLDLLTIRFVVEKSRSFWSPINDSFEDFKENLSEGISEAITGFAYLLPWLFILVPLMFFIRFLWRKWR